MKRMLEPLTASPRDATPRSSSAISRRFTGSTSARRASARRSGRSSGELSARCRPLPDLLRDRRRRGRRLPRSEWGRGNDDAEDAVRIPRPSAGEARVLGFQPSKRDHAFLRQITLVMGNRTQLLWDIPAADSFGVLKEIYGLPEAEYRKTLGDLVDLLDLAPLLHKPVRNLSSWRADEGRVHRGADSLAPGGVSRRADHRPRRDHAGTNPPLRHRVQPEARRDDPSDQPLHGRRRRALQTGVGDSSRCLEV